jgi:glycosyltransferase involved in cell wall biosynthesis
LPQDQVRAWLRRARLFVLPSVEEGLGVVLLEAMACGTPVVASRVDGIPEAVTEREGRLVPPADPGALAKAMIQNVGGR